MDNDSLSSAGSQLIPSRFSRARMSELSEDFQVVKGFIPSYAGRGLVLIGQAEIGKTHAMAALTRTMHGVVREMGAHLQFNFAPAVDVFERFGVFHSAAVKNVDSRFGRSHRDTYLGTDWLVIDDLGSEFRGGAVREQNRITFARILKHRYEHGRVTHITTRLSLEELHEVYGDRCFEQLRLACSVHTIDAPRYTSKASDPLPSSDKWKRAMALSALSKGVRALS